MIQTSTLIDTVKGLMNDSSLLVRQEIALAKAETREKVEQAKVGIAEIAAGAIIALVALFVLAQALVAALSNLMAPSLAALAVGVLLALVAWVCVSRGQKNLDFDNLEPTRTKRALKDNVRQAEQAL